MYSRPGLAAVLSFVIPGLGQIYNGHFVRAAFWLLIAFWWTKDPASWPMHAGFWVWATHFVSSLTAFNKARQVEVIAAWRAEMNRRTGDEGSGRIIDQ